MIEIPLINDYHQAAHNRRAAYRADAVCAVLRQRCDSGAREGDSRACADFDAVSRRWGSRSIRTGMTNWPLLVITEFLVGAGMGIATNIVFEAVQLSGQVLGVQMGYSLVNILDPQTQVDTTVMATFYQSIVMLLFLRMDVHYWLLRAVGNSYHDVPPGTAHIGSLFTVSLISSVGEVFSLGVQIAAPVLSATLAADIILGLLGKASPQMPLMLLGPAVKSVLGSWF